MSKTLKELIVERGIRAEVIHGAKEPTWAATERPEDRKWREQADGWTMRILVPRWISLPNNTRAIQRGYVRSAAFPFWQGSGLHGVEPTVEDVLSLLLSDAQAAQYTFEEWASDFGYQTDSRHAHAIYKACLKTAKILRRLLGDDDFKEFMESDRD